MFKMQQQYTANDRGPDGACDSQTQGSQCVYHPTHEESLASSPISQWSRFARDPGHAKMLLSWHAFCCLLDATTAGAVFAYGWRKSMIPFSFIVPVFSYVVLDGSIFLAYSLAGPLRSNAHPVFQLVGPIQGLQNMYITLATSFVPVGKKPFMKVWPSLLGFGVIGFTARTLATMTMMVHPDPTRDPFRILRHGIIGGAIASIRSLDSITDLQVGYMLVQEARDSVCFWKGEETSCRHMFGLAVTQIVLSVTDFLIGLYLQFNDMQLSAETSITWTKLAVHMTSLMCEVGMMGIYITSSIFLRSATTENPASESADTSSPASGGGGSPLDSRSQTEAILFIVMSLCLTGVVFFANMYGAGHMVVALLRATAKVAHTTASMSAAMFKPRASTFLRTELGLLQQQTCIQGHEHAEDKVGQGSAGGEVAEQDRAIQLEPGSVCD